MRRHASAPEGISRMCICVASSNHNQFRVWSFPAQAVQVPHHRGLLAIILLPQTIHHMTQINL